MPVIRSEFACPTCEQSGKEVQIIANAGELSCENGHRWNDTMEFMNLKPQMKFKVSMPKLPQPNQTPMTITVSIPLKADLEAKYGDKLQAVIVGVLRQVAEGEMLMISDTHLDRLRDLLGKRPDSAAELCGLVFNAKTELDNATAERDEAVRDRKAYEGLSPGRVVINLGKNYQPAVELAKDREQPLAMLLQDALTRGLENQWF